MIVPLTEAQLKAISNVCPRSQVEIDQDLAIIKHWLSKQPHLPSTSDEMIKKILFSLKYRTEKVKTVIDNYYTVKEMYPEIYGDFDPTTETFRRHVDQVHMFPLPKLSEDLSRVLCYRMMTNDSKSFCTDFQMKRNEMMWNWLFSQDALTLNNVWIFDIENMDSLAIWGHFNLNFMKKVLKTSMDAKPVRIKKVIFVNVSSIAETTLNFIKQFIPQKFRDRMVFSSSTDTLQNEYSLDMLPYEWGGKAGTTEELNNRMHEELIKRKQWCIDLQNAKADSRKRIGQTKTADESILGVEGNFKKLNFD